jgi:hypothetical protein
MPDEEVENRVYYFVVDSSSGTITKKSHLINPTEQPGLIEGEILLVNREVFKSWDVGQILPVFP